MSTWPSTVHTESKRSRLVKLYFVHSDETGALTEQLAKRHPNDYVLCVDSFEHRDAWNAFRMNAYQFEQDFVSQICMMFLRYPWQQRTVPLFVHEYYRHVLVIMLLLDGHEPTTPLATRLPSSLVALDRQYSDPNKIWGLVASM